MVIVGADAVHQPDAVVVLTGDAGLAVPAMLASCRLDELTCRAPVSGMEDNAVIGVPGHLFCMVLGGYIGRGDDTCIQEDIGQDHCQRCTHPMNRRHPRPCWREKRQLSPYKQGREEYLRMLASSPS